MIPLQDIRAAAALVAGRVYRTPLLECPVAGEAGPPLFLKCENLQQTGSFKARGALHKALRLTAGERKRGLITVSAGNHAQAVAWAGAEVGAPCTVVMPEGAPRTKVEAVRGYGAAIVFHPDRATLFDRLHRERERLGAVFIHPFDDPVVLAGAGTAGLEIAEDLPDLDAVVVPVGGGGLMAGVVSAVRALCPDAVTVAVELEAGPGLGPALRAGKPVPVPRPVETLADGMTPPFVGGLPLAVAREAVDAVVTVTEAEILDAMRLLLHRARLVVEGAGAAATAAVFAGKAPLPPGARTAVLVSGGNLDPETIRDRVLGSDPPAGTPEGAKGKR